MRDGPLGRILIATRDIKPLGKDLLIIDINLINKIYYNAFKMLAIL